MPHFFKVHLALFTATLMFSLSYVLSKMVIPLFFLPFAIVLIRVWVSAALFWGFDFWISKEKISSAKDFGWIALCSLFGIVLNQLFFFKGLSLSSPIKTAILMTTIPIMILGISLFFLKEKISMLKWMGVCLGALGALLLIIFTNQRISFVSDSFLGDVFLLLNALFYSIYLVMMKPMMLKYSSLTVIKWAFLFGCIGVLPVGMAEFMLIDWQRLPFYAWWVLLFIVVGSTFLAYLLNAWGLKFVHAGVVGFYIYLQPMLTSLIAIALGKDELTPTKILFALMIMAGVYLVSRE